MLSPATSGPRMAGIATAALMTVGLLSGANSRVAEPPPEPLEYVALGDSYSAGVGAGQYINECGVSPLGFPERLDQQKSIELVANPSCGGATTTDIAPGDELPAQVLSLGAETDLVTVTIGGNDVGFGALVAGCSPDAGSPACAEAIRDAQRYAEQELPAELRTTFQAIREEAPDAHVVVMGYAPLFSPQFGRLGSATDGAEALNAGVDQLNSAIRNAATSAGFQYIDVAKEFRNHAVGAPQPWIHAGGAVFHPTAEGYKKGYLKPFKTEVQINKLQMTTDSR